MTAQSDRLVEELLSWLEDCARDDPANPHAANEVLLALTAALRADLEHILRGRRAAGPSLRPPRPEPRRDTGRPA